MGFCQVVLPDKRIRHTTPSLCSVLGLFDVKINCLDFCLNVMERAMLKGRKNLHY